MCSETRRIIDLIYLNMEVCVVGNFTTCSVAMIVSTFVGEDAKIMDGWVCSKPVERHLVSPRLLQSNNLLEILQNSLSTRYWQAKTKCYKTHTLLSHLACAATLHLEEMY